MTRLLPGTAGRRAGRRRGRPAPRGTARLFKPRREGDGMNTAWAVVGKVRWSREKGCWRVEADSTRLGIEPDATAFVVRESQVRDQLREGWVSAFTWEQEGEDRVIRTATLLPMNDLNEERKVQDVPFTYHEILRRRRRKPVVIVGFSGPKGAGGDEAGDDGTGGGDGEP